MPIYKDEKTNTWYCKFYYVNWQGQKKQKLKRGFKLQRDAKDWERKFLEQFSKNPDITFEYCKFYYVNWQGQKKQKLKRGFKLQRDAKDWERKFLEQFSKNPDITFEALYQKYKAYITPRIRESSSSVRFGMLDKHVLPFFKDRIISDIGPSDIAAWQTELLKKNLSDSYAHMINVYLKAIFSYAVEYMGLPKNPCTKSIGSLKSQKINFWTPEEYKQFSEACKDNLEYFTLFELLYYTGMRVGEALALTLNDIDFVWTPEEYKQFSEACKDNLEYFTLFELLYYTGMRVGEALALTLNDIDFGQNIVSINKTYYRIAGKDLINPPKTAGSERTILMPDFLTSELLDYVGHLYEPAPDDRIFNKRPQYVRSVLRDRAKKAGVKQIRVHDLRHSHASMLINLGANPLLVAERLGHESPAITLKTYSHLFPSTQNDIVSKIKKI